MKTPSLPLPQEGFVRLNQILAVIPVSRSTLYKWISEGRFPKPEKPFGEGVSLWKANTIRQILESDDGAAA